MENAERLKRLELLNTMLMEHDHIFSKVKFDIDVWNVSGEENINNVYHRVVLKKSGEICGTAACALGSAALYEPFMKMGLRIGYYNAPLYDENSEFDAGAEFFGINGRESEYLFSPSEYDQRKVTPRTVAKRVRELIKQYSKAAA